MSATDGTEGMSPLAGGRHAVGGEGTATPYQRVQASGEFTVLRSRWRRYVFLMSGLFLGWFLVYVLLAAFVPGVVDTRLGGTHFTLGLLLGLLQFVSTFVITTAYVRYADRHLDPEAQVLRRRVEETP